MSVRRELTCKRAATHECAVTHECAADLIKIVTGTQKRRLLSRVDDHTRPRAAHDPSPPNDTEHDTAHDRQAHGKEHAHFVGFAHDAGDIMSVCMYI